MFTALLFTAALAKFNNCVGRCDNPAPLTFDGLTPNQAMMNYMTNDIYEAIDTFLLNKAADVSVTGAEVVCTNGFANEYPCKNINLLSYIPHTKMGARGGNDIWGWEDPLTGKEYAIVGQLDGTAFVDISDPVNPIYKGRIPTKTTSSTWRDIKVFKNHAYIVSEATNHGIQVYDLTLLREPFQGNNTMVESAYYGATGRCHNVVINEETGLLVCVGSRNVCNAGLYMLDINEPKNPKYLGCYPDDGYTHDAQCVIYKGPDAKYQGKEICFGYNEDTLSIVDVTNRAKPVLLSRTGYPQYAYTHQGWLLEDQTYLMFDDELDEKRNTNKNNGNTTTYIVDVRNLEQPVMAGTHISPVTAIDHNLYIKGDLAYMSNYGAGLRVVNIANMKSQQTNEVAYFDVHPEDNNVSYSGSWSSYIYFKSGTIITNSIERGLFVLRPTF